MSEHNMYGICMSQHKATYNIICILYMYFIFIYNLSNICWNSAG